MKQNGPVGKTPIAQRGGLCDVDCHAKFAIFFGWIWSLWWDEQPNNTACLSYITDNSYCILRVKRGQVPFFAGKRHKPPSPPAVYRLCGIGIAAIETYKMALASICRAKESFY
jgi:hypothetical protein